MMVVGIKTLNLWWKMSVQGIFQLKYLDDTITHLSYHCLLPKNCCGRVVVHLLDVCHNYFLMM